MPECYTYASIANQALIRSGQTVASQPAFLAGANGPDPLSMYRFWKRAKSPNLPALAVKMHREDTGAFLYTLIRLSSTPVQQSYALGFLTHYTTDCTLYPYIAAMTLPGGPYAEAKGKCIMETSLDSALYFENYKTLTVPVHAGTPVLITEDLALVTSLLHDSIKEVYLQDIPPVALADTFHDNLSVRRFLVSPRGGKRLLSVLLGPFLHNKKDGAAIRYRMQPGKPLRKLPEKWVNPFSREEMDMTLSEVLALAETTGAACITAAMRFWLGEVDDAQLKEILGDNNYYTGLPSKKTQPHPEEKQA